MLGFKIISKKKYNQMQSDLKRVKCSLTICVSKCDQCENEQSDCCKYEFGSHLFCLKPKY